MLRCCSSVDGCEQLGAVRGVVGREARGRLRTGIWARRGEERDWRWYSHYSAEAWSLQPDTTGPPGSTCPAANQGLPQYRHQVFVEKWSFQDNCATGKTGGVKNVSLRKNFHYILSFLMSFLICPLPLCGCCHSDAQRQTAPEVPSLDGISGATTRLMCSLLPPSKR